MSYTPILATLGYVLDATGERVLLVHRTARDDDHQHGLYNGLGGKLEPGEDALAGLRRELAEEAGIQLTRAELRGTLNWPAFGPHGEDWFGLVFVVTGFDGTPRAASPEGDLAWVPITELDTLPMYDGDRLFLPLVFDPEIAQFHGVLRYQGRRLVQSHLETISR